MDSDFVQAGDKAEDKFNIVSDSMVFADKDNIRNQKCH
jgi:hypothetical protein